jgi:thiol:disulfide interchange protein DsbD
MGLTMGLAAAPCVGPIVLGLLLFVGSRQDPLLGFAIFFVLALGLGAPYVILAALADSIRRLPRSGGWLAWVEKLLGFVLVALALFYVQPLLPLAARRPAALVLLAVAGLYLGFLEGTLRESLRFTRFKRGVGVAALGIALWNLAGDRPHPIEWQPLTPQAFAAARAARRPSVIDFSAEWCIPCREMDETTFRDPAVVDAARRFVMLRADVTVIDPDTDELMRRYGVLGVPTYVFFRPGGEEARRLVGYVPSQEFVQAMRAAAGG